MKQRRNFLLGAITLASVMLFSAPAFATPACGQGAINEAGSVYIEHDGDCVINGGINADWDVTVKATGAITVTGSITSGGQVYLESQGGNLSTDAITATSGAIYIYSAGDLTTGALDSDFETALFPNGNLTINGAATFAYGFTADNSVGNVHITGALTSKDQDYSYLIISAAGLGKTIVLDGNITAPGYDVSLAASGNISTKTIDTHYASSDSSTIRILANTSDSGSTPFVIGAGGSNGINGSVNATRGSGKTIFAVQNGGTGGIDVDGDVIQIQSSSGPSGSLIFKAETGEVKIKGHLSVDGASGQRAGQIVVTANTVKTTGGAQITANDTFETDHNHYVTIAATSLTYTGGLTISVNGDTYSGLYLMPKGSNPVFIDPSPSTIISVSSANAQRAPLTVASTDSSTLTLNVSGRNNRVNLSAYPLVFNGGPLTINADRSNVFFIYPGVAANNNSLTFNGGTVTVNANSSISSENAGTITLAADRLPAPLPAVNLYANGGKDGGKILVQAVNGTIPFGVGTGKIRVNAKSGTANGDGGEIKIFAPTVTVADSNASGTALIAKAVGTNGKGGNIEIAATTLSFSGSDSEINVDGKGTGDGGEVKLNTGTGITVDQGNTGNVKISAKSVDSGSGGTITLISGGPQTFDAAEISLNAGPNGNGHGGELISTSSGMVTVSGEIQAKGHGDGAGGTVTFTTGFDLEVNLFNVDISGGDNGEGGKFSANKAKALSTSLPIDLQTIKIDAGINTVPTAFQGSIALNVNSFGDPITCRRYKNDKASAPIWPSPYGYWHCMATSIRKELALNTAKSLDDDALSAMTTIDPAMFVFANAAEYTAFFVKAPNTEPGLLVSGFWSSTENRIVIYERGTDSTGLIEYGQSDAAIASTVRHEIAHVLDVPFGTTVGRANLSEIGGGFPASYSFFVSRDFRNMTFVGPLYITQKPACGTGGVFEGRIDEAGNAVCTSTGLQSRFAGQNNEQILRTMFSYHLATYSPASWQELWPEQFALASGAGPSRTLHSYLIDLFPCSNIYAQNFYSTGTAAGSGAYSSIPECN